MAEFTLHIGNKCFSSWSLRPWIAMKHFGIAFDEKLVRLRQPGTAAELAKVSPTGQVPVLVHNGKTIWETLAILEYLADLFPEKGFWPKHREGRGLARCVSTEMHSGFRELRYAWPMNLRHPPAKKAVDGIVEAQRARIEALWAECLASKTDDGPYLFGPFTAADAMYAPVVTRFERYAGPLSGPTKQYVETMLANPAMREWYEGAAAEPFPEPGPDE